MSDHPQHLGRYRLVSLLGEGGMGKVYKAHDATLDRHVAIKVLPADIEDSRVQRFMLEARAASALNHPHVISVYDIGEADNVRYIAMELIEGQTLRDLTAAGRLDLRKALKLVMQVAEALTAAHAADIIHRDLKPENIMVTNAGYAKVLDFGLAKLRLRESSDDSHTLVKETDPGTVMGTVGYMSPEQALGKAVDHRSDLFSLGCVLYEMVGGRRAFQGTSSIDTLHEIIHNDPRSIRTLRNDAPQELIRIIRKAMAKDPDERYQTAKDMVIDLRELLRDFDSAPVAVATLPKRRWIGPAIVMAVLLIAVVVITLARRDADARLASSRQQQHQLRITRVTASGKVIAAVISNDGKFVAYNVSEQGEQSLWVRQMASGQSLQLIAPARVAYWGLSFSPDGSIYYAIKSREDQRGAIYQISPLGGGARRIITGVDSQPTFSPDGKRMAFLRARFPSDTESAVIVANVDGSDEKTLASAKAPELFVPIFYAGASWSPDGKIIAAAVVDRSARKGFIVAIDVAGGAVRTIADAGWLQVGQVAWMPDGKGLVAIASRAEDQRSQVWYVPYPSGAPAQVTNDLFDYRIASLSADGSSLMTVATDVAADVWVQEDGAQPKRITQAKFEGGNGVATLPGSRIVMTSLETGKGDLWLTNADGTGRTLLTRDAYENRWPVTTSDGRTVVYVSVTSTGYLICAMNADGSGRRVLTSVLTSSYSPSVSPDGKWVAYTTLSLQHKNDLVVARAPIDGGSPEVLTEYTAFGPVYSPDGKWIAAYLGGPRIAIIPAAGGAPARELQVAPGYAASQIAWASDGKSLILNTAPSDRANLWQFPLDGSAPRRLTNFDEHSLMSFARLRENNGWVLSRGDMSRDAVLITGFRR